MSLLSWLDNRTGYKGLLRGALYEHIPGGARWRYVWGSTLVFVFVVQMITGLFLWMHYSPSSQTAWESVYYIQHEMTGGWLLRGIHHYAAQTMIILLALHMLQVIIDGAYRAPREFNFWIGLLLLLTTLALALTGYLLPWDQKGYWSTKVATALMAVVPFVGEPIQRLVVGGPEYGHHTLTRFFALHAGLLPAALIGLTVAHVYAFRRHGITAKEPKRGSDSYFWPDQVLRDAVACLGVLLFILFLCVRGGLFGDGTMAERFGDPGHLGAELSAPADPAEPYGAARPEWYFLFLFQFLKLPVFAGSAEIYGAVVIPSAIMVVLFLMPLIGRWRVGHWFNVAFTIFLGVGMVLLTLMAIVEDVGGPAMRLPVLGSFTPLVNVVLLGLMIAAVLVLIPLFTKERSFRFNVATLGALLLLTLVGLGAAFARTAKGADAAATAATASATAPAVTENVAVASERFTFAAGGRQYDLESVMLLALLTLLVLFLTVVVFRDYPHANEVRMTPEEAAGAERRGRGDPVPYTGVSHEPGNPALDPGDAGVTRAERSLVISDNDDNETAGDTTPGKPISLRRWELHHRVRLGMLLAVVIGVTFLAAVDLIGGQGKPEYLLAVAQAQEDARRIVALAKGPAGIPPVGAILILRDDPKTQGPKLFAAHCAACHRYDGHDGRGYVDKNSQPSAPDLGGFATRKWLTEMMDPKLVDTHKFFGPLMAAHEGAMVEFVKTNMEELDEADAKDLKDIIIALSAEANLPAQREIDAADTEAIARGKVAMSESTFECTDCHNWYDKKSSFKGKNRGPDLTGYGSEQWTVDFIKNPAHERFYNGHNDRMPLYGEDKILTEKSITLLTKWMRGDWYEPGRPFEVVIRQGEATPGDGDLPPPGTAPATSPAPVAAPMPGDAAVPADAPQAANPAPATPAPTTPPPTIAAPPAASTPEPAKVEETELE